MHLFRYIYPEFWHRFCLQAIPVISNQTTHTATGCWNSSSSSATNDVVSRKRGSTTSPCTPVYSQSIWTTYVTWLDARSRRVSLVFLFLSPLPLQILINCKSTNPGKNKTRAKWYESTEPPNSANLIFLFVNANIKRRHCRGGWFELIDAAKVETKVVKSSRGHIGYKLINCTTKINFSPHGYLHAKSLNKFYYFLCSCSYYIFNLYFWYGPLDISRSSLEFE